MPKIREYPEASLANSNDALILDTEEGTKYIKASNLVGPSSSTVDRMTASGSVAHFEDGADNVPMKSVKVAIEPVQDLHGYDHPWPAGGGKNLLNIPDGVLTVNGVTTTSKDGVVTLSGTASARAIIVLRRNIAIPAGTYKLNGAQQEMPLSMYLNFSPGNAIGISQTNNINDPEITLTEPSTGDELSYLHFDIASGINTDGMVFKPMLRKSTEDASFAPYSNICPITGWTGAKVTRAGKNLLNPSDPDYDNYTIGADGTPTTNPKRIVTGFISCDEGVSLTFSTNKKTDTTGEDIRFGFAGIAAYDKDKNFLSRETANRTRSVTMVTPTGTKYVRVFEENTSAGFPGTLTPAVFSAYGQQLELGSTATDYEPYSGQTYDITFPTEAGTVYGGTLDVTSGVLTVDRAMVDLGTPTWTKHATRTNVFQAYRPNTSPAWAMIPNGGIADAVCDTYKFTTSSLGGVGDIDMSIALGTGTSVIMYVHDSRFTDVSDFISSVSGSKIVYPLATPITYQLTPQEITSLLGENNVWADTGDSEVGYRADTKLYIDAKIAELQALVLENNGGN